MKKTLKGLAMIALVAISAPACKKKGCTDSLADNYNADAKKDDNSCTFCYQTNAPVDLGSACVTSVSINGTDYWEISGTITKSATLAAAQNWVLSGGVFVEDGATLTIEPGTTVYTSNDGTTPFLAVKQGGMIDAEGTASNPIVFTPVSANPAPGDWGGIILNGYAPINTAIPSYGEGGTGAYGGTNTADNSGTLAYVRVEYAGKLLGTDNELNGFAFYAVGNGTTVHHLQAYRGSDDGFEWFGGTVNVSHLVSTGNHDDSFDWTQGWTGNAQFLIAQQLTDAGDRGIEADNNGDDNSATPYSFPTLSNVTLIGADDGDGKNQGVKLREGTKAMIYNMVATNFPKRGVQVEHDVTLANMEAGSVSVMNSIIDNTNPFVYTDNNGDAFTATSPFENDATNAITGSPVTTSSYIGASATNAANPTSINPFFTAGSFIGAVDASNDWTAGWINTDLSI